MKSTYPYEMPFKWEQIYHCEVDLAEETLESVIMVDSTYRAKVIGGWLISQEKSIINSSKSITPTIALQFIPDPEHVWKITEDKN